MTNETQLCELCGVADRVKGNRYCKQCGKQILSKLRESGFLQETRERIVSDQKGRAARSSQVLSGAPDMRTTEDMD